MGPRYVIYGPPDSGKSTWVFARAKRDDLVWDFDRVTHALTAGYVVTRHQQIGPWIERAARECREAIVQWLSKEEIGAAAVFIIVTHKGTATRIAQSIGASLVEIGALDAISERRIEAPQ